MKKIIIFGTITLVALIVGSVYAWSPGRGWGMGGGGFGQGCPYYGNQYSSDSLSAEQRTQLSDLQQKYIDETYEVRSQALQKSQELNLLMETSNPDRAELNKLSEELAELQAQLRNKGLDYQLEVKRVSPEQTFSAGDGNKWSTMNGRRGWGGCQGRRLYN